MMAIHERALFSGKRCHKASFQKPHAMRAAVARPSLLMLYSFRQCRRYVLYESAAARDVQYLHPETDCKQWHTKALHLFKHKIVRLVFQRMNAAKPWMRVTAIAQRVNVGIASGQKNSIKPLHQCLYVISSWNQADMNGRSYGSLNSLAIVARQIETIRLQLYAHRYAYTRPLFNHPSPL